MIRPVTFLFAALTGICGTVSMAEAGAIIPANGSLVLQNVGKGFEYLREYKVFNSLPDFTGGMGPPPLQIVDQFLDFGFNDIVPGGDPTIKGPDAATSPKFGDFEFVHVGFADNTLDIHARTNVSASAEIVGADGFDGPEWDVVTARTHTLFAVQDLIQVSPVSPSDNGKPVKIDFIWDITGRFGFQEQPLPHDTGFEVVVFNNYVARVEVETTIRTTDSAGTAPLPNAQPFTEIYKFSGAIDRPKPTSPFLTQATFPAPAATGTHTLTANYGEEFEFYVEVDLIAGLEIDGLFDGAKPYLLSLNNYDTTFEFRGLTITDQNGNLVTDARVTSALGIDYAIVPEPSALTLFMLGLLAHSHRRRRS